MRTLGEASVRAGFRVHAYALMSNHYHWLLETPKANLSRGMGWMQNAFTRQVNTRHRLWGHVFGGSYKSILVEPGNCFWALLDYIHLNPVRAGMIREAEGLESYPWSSVSGYHTAGQKVRVAGNGDGLGGLRLQGYGGRAKGVFGNPGLARGLEESFKGGGVAVGGR